MATGTSDARPTGVLEPAGEALLEVEGVDKRFPGIQALRGVSVDFQAGEIHALLGANGAGKSTLAQVIAGAQPADAGDIRFEGKSVIGLSPTEIAQRGIGMIYQQLKLFPPLSVAENLALLRGSYPHRGGLVRRREMRDQASYDLARIEHDYIDPDSPVADLRLTDAWFVAIAAALARDPKLLILDESTAALPENDVETIFEFLRKRRDQGLAIILITHRVDEVQSMADRITVLKDGTVSGQVQRGSDKRRIVELMFSEEIADRLTDSRDREPVTGEALLELSNVRSERLRGLNLQVRRGEVLGIAGAIGSGRSEIVRVLNGEQPVRLGEIKVEGEPFQPSNAAAAMRRGIATVPQDRETQGLLHGLPLASNITISSLDALRHAFSPFLDRRRERETVGEVMSKLSIKGRPREPIESLSGGNCQKALIARSLLLDAQLLILDEPTIGVDVATRLELREILQDLARQGRAVIEISSEFDDLIRDCTRIAVLRNGIIVEHDAPFDEAAIAHIAYSAEAA